jgi:ketosteroid isomerase-like protein
MGAGPPTGTSATWGGHLMMAVMNHALATTDRRAFLAMAAVLPLQLTSAGGSPATVIAALRRAYEGLDELALEDVLAPDITFEDPTFHLKFEAFDAMRPLIADVKREVRSIRITVERELVCGAWVVARQTQTVTRHAAPDRPIVVRGVSLFRVAGSRVVEWYDYYDALGYQRQVGGGNKEVE